MKEDLRNKITDAFGSETPDFREKIIESCGRVTQVPPSEPSASPSVSGKKAVGKVYFRRLVAVVSCLVFFVAGLFVGQIIPGSQSALAAETFVYLDVNPSIELSLDENNNVLSCTAANEDARVILNGMNLENVELKTALNAIVGAMYVNGYLNREDNSILISVDTSDKSNTAAYLTYITDRVNEVFVNSEMNCSIIAQGVNADESLQHRAEEQGISVGKMRLLEKIIEKFDEFDEDSVPRLSGMSIKDLNMIYSMKPDDKDPDKEDDPDDDDDELISGKVNGYIDKDDALEAVLDYLEKDEDDIREYRIFVSPSEYDRNRIAYIIIVNFDRDPTTYGFEVDCLTGTVSESHFPKEAYPKAPEAPPPGNPQFP